MRESELHAHIAQGSLELSAKYSQVVLGPGDDCAVVRTGRGDQLLVTVDQLVEKRHYDPADLSVELIARKAIARSVSDIAAMGGTPVWGLATGLLPAGYRHAAELFDAMARWARHWGAPLVGGDVASWGRDEHDGGRLVLTVTIAGVPSPGRGPIVRSGARAGDEVYVTGRFGGSLKSGRHASFEPRVREGRWLADTLGPDLHAMIDVSDGLGRDAGRIATASGVRLEIEGARLPRHVGVDDVMSAMSDGEDYELCFAAAPGVLESAGLIPGGAEFARVGRVIEGPAGCTLVHADGRREDAAALGWDH